MVLQSVEELDNLSARKASLEDDRAQGHTKRAMAFSDAVEVSIQYDVCCVRISHAGVVEFKKSKNKREKQKQGRTTTCCGFSLLNRFLSFISVADDATADRQSGALARALWVLRCIMGVAPRRSSKEWSSRVFCRRGCVQACIDVQRGNKLTFSRPLIRPPSPSLAWLQASALSSSPRPRRSSN